MAEWLIAFCALGALVVSVWNMLKIRELHIVVNSRLSQLLEITATAARAEGHLQGVVESTKCEPH